METCAGMHKVSPHVVHSPKLKAHSPSYHIPHPRAGGRDKNLEGCTQPDAAYAKPIEAAHNKLGAMHVTSDSNRT